MITKLSSVKYILNTLKSKYLICKTGTVLVMDFLLSDEDNNNPKQ
jgi:hypothetical protein